MSIPDPDIKLGDFDQYRDILFDERGVTAWVRYHALTHVTPVAEAMQRINWCDWIEEAPRPIELRFLGYVHMKEDPEEPGLWHEIPRSEPGAAIWLKFLVHLNSRKGMDSCLR